jgi:hypothetical protein
VKNAAQLSLARTDNSLLMRIPPRPFRLRRSFTLSCYFGATVALLLALALLPANIVWQCVRLRHAREVDRIWATGVEATAEVHGQGPEYPIAHDYTFSVTFSDEYGDKYSGETSFTASFARIPFEDEAVVRYDPKDPSRFALGWEVELGWKRWFGSFFVMGVFGLLGIVALLTIRIPLRLLADARACPQSSSEEQVELVRVDTWTRNSPDFLRPHKYRIGGLSSRDYAWIVSTHEPLWTDDRKTHAVALVAPDGRRIVLRDDLHPFQQA